MCYICAAVQLLHLHTSDRWSCGTHPLLPLRYMPQVYLEEHAALYTFVDPL